MNPGAFAAREPHILDCAWRSLAGEMRGYGLSPLRAVLGMEWKLREEIGASTERRFYREAIQLEHARRRVELVRGDVPIPVPFARSLHRERVALFRKSECLL